MKQMLGDTRFVLFEGDVLDVQGAVNQFCRLKDVTCEYLGAEYAFTGPRFESDGSLGHRAQHGLLLVFRDRGA